MTVRSVIRYVKSLLKLFVIAWAILVSKVYYRWDIEVILIVQSVGVQQFVLLQILLLHW